jgi:hypothetical protein
VWVALFNDEFGCLWRQLVIFDPHCNTEAHKHGALADMVEDILDKSPGVQPLPLEQYERSTSWQHWEATLFTSKDVRA